MASLDELYARVPDAGCKGLCKDSCGPIAMTEIEWLRLGSPEPAIHEGGNVWLGLSELACTVLVEGRCSNYDARPMICRLWGATETMACPWGCRPLLPLTDAEARHLLRETRGAA